MLYSRHRHRHRQYVSQTTRTLPPQSERNHEYQKTLGFWAVHSVPRSILQDTYTHHGMEASIKHQKKILYKCMSKLQAAELPGSFEVIKVSIKGLNDMQRDLIRYIFKNIARKKEIDSSNIKKWSFDDITMREITKTLQRHKHALRFVTSTKAICSRSLSLRIRYRRIKDILKLNWETESKLYNKLWQDLRQCDRSHKTLQEHICFNLRKQLHLMQEQLEAATSCSKKICKKIIALNARFDKKIKKAEEIILEKCIRRGKVLVKRKSYMPKDAEIKNSVPSCYRRFTITKLLLGLSLAMI